MTYRVYRISSGKTVVKGFESEDTARAWLDDYREEKQHFYDVEEIDEEDAEDAEDDFAPEELKVGDVVEDDEDIDSDEGLFHREEDDDDDDDDGSFEDADGFHDADLENE